MPPKIHVPFLNFGQKIAQKGSKHGKRKRLAFEGQPLCERVTRKIILQRRDGRGGLQPERCRHSSSCPK